VNITLRPTMPILAGEHISFSLPGFVMEGANVSAWFKLAELPLDAGNSTNDDTTTLDYAGNASQWVRAEGKWSSDASTLTISLPALVPAARTFLISIPEEAGLTLPVDGIRANETALTAACDASFGAVNLTPNPETRSPKP